MHATACPGRDQLASFVLGTLAEQEAREVDEHLTTCSKCTAALETMDGVEDTVIRGLRESEASSEMQFLDEPEFVDAVRRLRRLGPHPSVAGQLDESSVAECLPERFGEFRILGRIGQGGMGTVYRARHLRLGKIVALKVLPKDRLRQAEAKARFDREMLAVGQLEHPNIVRAYDGREIDGQPVLVMEYVDGMNLSKLVGRLGSLQVPEACELARQAAVGLEFIHQYGLVHRDIKPSNLMLAWSDRVSGPMVKILDLGLARLRVDDQLAAELTAEGRAMGTVDYMSPEQALDSRKADIRSDLYSLGCTLYKLLAGRAPFDLPGYRKSAQKLAGHLRDTPPAIRHLCPDVPEGVGAILDRLLAKSPPNRYQTPLELAEALAPFASGADLTSLIHRAASSAIVPGNESRQEVNADGSTDPFVRSAVSGTDAGRVIEACIPVAVGLHANGPVSAASHGEATSAAPLPRRRRRLEHIKSFGFALGQFFHDPARPRWLKVAAAFAPLPLVLLLGVMVLVRLPDGREVAADVPDGHQVTVDAQKGTVEIGPRSEKPTPPPAEPEPQPGTLIASPASIVPEVEPPLGLLWQKELTRPFENRISGVRLTTDQKHLIVFHFTHSPLAPVEKLNSRTGQVLWERAPRLKDRCSIAGWVDGEDHLYLASAWGGHTLWKTDPELGRVLWHFTGGEGFEYVLGVQTDASGNVYASGYTGSFYPRGSRAVKLDPAGRLLWERLALYGRGTDQYCAMVLDSQGNLFRAGFDNIDPNRPAENVGRVIGHAADDGREILNKTLEEDNSRVGGVAVDAEDNLVVACTLGFYGADRKLSADARVVVEKRNRRGDVVWQCPIPGEAASTSGANALARRPDGSFLLSYLRRKDGLAYPALAAVSNDGVLAWTSSIDAPGWDCHLSNLAVNGDVIYLGLTNTDDVRQSQVLSLEVLHPE